MEREHLMILEMLREHAMECTGCGACEKVCPMDVKVRENPDSMECIRCMECSKVCTAEAIRFYI